jgi:hypothetical protein
VTVSALLLWFGGGAGPKVGLLFLDDGISKERTEDRKNKKKGDI